MIELLYDQPADFDLYLFGSALYSDNYKDIDLALIYDKEKVDLRQIIDYRKKIILTVAKEFRCPCTVLLLSTKEEKEMSFLENAKTYKLK